MSNRRKVVLIGTGFVGMSMAYSLLSTGGIDELVLIDVDFEKAKGEAMDLQHGLPYANCKMNIYAGTYQDCHDADVIVITAGVSQTPEETRLDLTTRNARIMKSISESIMESGFDGIIVVASNPVDAMTCIVQRITKLPHERVIGSGTLLDTARLRYLVGEYLNISTSNIHAYIMGEHGDSSFVPWTNAYVGSKSLLELMDEKQMNMDDLLAIYTQVQQAGYEIVKRKKSTYYGIGLSLNRLIQAIFNDENVILTLSVYQDQTYNNPGLYIGVPAIINRGGIKEIVKLPLNTVDQNKFNASCKTLREINELAFNTIIK